MLSEKIQLMLTDSNRSLSNAILKKKQIGKMY